MHHSDGGCQYLLIGYTERLEIAGIAPSVGSVGDSYDNALAETVIGLYKAELIWRRGHWRSVEPMEFATLEWVDWFNNPRLLKPIGDMPPVEFERLCGGIKSSWITSMSTEDPLRFITRASPLLTPTSDVYRA